MRLQLAIESEDTFPYGRHTVGNDPTYCKCSHPWQHDQKHVFDFEEKPAAFKRLPRRKAIKSRGIILHGVYACGASVHTCLTNFQSCQWVVTPQKIVPQLWMQRRRHAQLSSLDSVGAARRTSSTGWNCKVVAVEKPQCWRMVVETAGSAANHPVRTVPSQSTCSQVLMCRNLVRGILPKTCFPQPGSRNLARTWLESQKPGSRNLRNGCSTI